MIDKIKNIFKKEELSEEDQIKIEARKIRASIERARKAKQAGLVLAGAAVGAGSMYLYNRYASTKEEGFEETSNDFE